MLNFFIQGAELNKLKHSYVKDIFEDDIVPFPEVTEARQSKIQIQAQFYLFSVYSERPQCKHVSNVVPELHTETELFTKSGLLY